MRISSSPSSRKDEGASDASSSFRTEGPSTRIAHPFAAMAMKRERRRPTVWLRHLSIGELVKDLTLELYPGEMFALLGVSGVGKTTLIQSVLAARRSIQYQGDAYLPRGDNAVGYLPQGDHWLPPGITPRNALSILAGSPAADREAFFKTAEDGALIKNLDVDPALPRISAPVHGGRDPRGGRRISPSRARGRAGSFPLECDESQETKCGAEQEDHEDHYRPRGRSTREVPWINRYLGKFHLEKCADTRVSCLSGGERKRLNIAITLLSAPPLLLLDEPLSGLDDKEAASILEILKNYSLSRRASAEVSVSKSMTSHGRVLSCSESRCRRS